jgi:hypothetical protein
VNVIVAMIAGASAFTAILTVVRDTLRAQLASVTLTPSTAHLRNIC